MRWLRALAVWLAIVVAETLHGVARTLWLTPIVGDHAARQIGVGTGSVLIFVVTWLAIRWIGLVGRRELLATGALWVVLMLAFEIALGRTVMGFDWDRIAAEFDPRRGGLLLFGHVALLLMPLLTARLRGLDGAMTGSPGRERDAQSSSPG
jgi:hypothetical protein